MSASDKMISFKNTLILGIGIGTAIGLLLAPWEGKKTRKLLVDNSKRIANFFSGHTDNSLNEIPDVTILVIESDHIE